MGEVVDLTEKTRLPRRRPDDGRRGEIALFTGVRIERRRETETEGDTPPGSRRRRRRRPVE